MAADLELQKVFADLQQKMVQTRSQLNIAEAQVIFFFLIAVFFISLLLSALSFWIIGGPKTTRHKTGKTYHF